MEEITSQPPSPLMDPNSVGQSNAMTAFCEYFNGIFFQFDNQFEKTKHLIHFVLHLDNVFLQLLYRQPRQWFQRMTLIKQLRRIKIIPMLRQWFIIILTLSISIRIKTILMCLGKIRLCQLPLSWIKQKRIISIIFIIVRCQWIVQPSIGSLCTASRRRLHRWF